MAPEQANLSKKKEEGSHIELNGDFKKALSLMNETTKNVFITGRAGTGKSTLIDHFKSNTKKNVVVLAPTGVAALNVKGQTIHSFFHFKPGITPDTTKILYPNLRAAYRKLDAILIDEISMVRADLLDCIDSFMRLNGKDRSLPFGGVQMIFIGDLYQLPPVVAAEEFEMFRENYKSEYFFDAHSFEKLPITYIELKKNYRHTDEHFIGLLNAIRNNTATEKDLEEINGRYNPFFSPNVSEKYISLTTTNKLADEINSAQMKKLPGREYTYAAKYDGDFEKKSFPAEENLAIKVGAQVMMLNNDKSDLWVNGSVGTITAITPGITMRDEVLVELTEGPIVEVNPHKWEMFKSSYDKTSLKLNSKVAGSFVQYPIMLAWAITIHKSQGKTFKHVIIDVGSGTFAYGQLYVALSRCTSLEGIVLTKKIEKRHIMMDQRIINFLRSIKFE